jgi:hypothetical protein
MLGHDVPDVEGRADRVFVAFQSAARESASAGLPPSCETGSGSSPPGLRRWDQAIQALTTTLRVSGSRPSVGAAISVRTSAISALFSAREARLASRER